MSSSMPRQGVARSLREPLDWAALPPGSVTGWLEVSLAGKDAGVGQVRMRIRRDTVEIWAEERCHGVFDRELLRGWLAGQRDWLLSDDVLLTAGPAFVALAIRGRLALGTLSPEALRQLVEQV